MIEYFIHISGTAKQKVEKRNRPLTHKYILTVNIKLVTPNILFVYLNFVIKDTA